MAKFAFALAAIIILILSAGLTHSQLQTTPLRAGVTSAAAFRDNTEAFRAELMLMQDATPASTAQRSTNEEPPAPALLVYLTVILVGGAGAVALARRRLHGPS
ncbi:MAG: hypothetical protein ABIV47_14715 [Roseiflexaceae bacterium]